MGLAFIGIIPSTPDDECPAVYVDEDTGDILFQGETVTDPDTLAEAASHSPIGAKESIVRLPSVMKAIILEAVYGTYEPGRRGPGRHSRIADGPQGARDRSVPGVACGGAGLGRAPGDA
jgi:hypothetical protein